MAGETIPRKIMFFRADVGRDGGGKPLPFFVERVMEHIAALPFGVGEGRYFVEPDGNALCLFPEASGRALMMCRIRRNGLPRVELAGNILDLDLDDDAGLMEATHVVFFEENIVGIEYNHYGPRPGGLARYVRSKCADLAPLLAFHPVLRNDVSQDLSRLQEIRLLEFRILPSYQAVVRAADESLGAAFAASASVMVGQRELSLVIKPEKEARTRALSRFRRPVTTLAEGGEIRQNSTCFQARGRCDDTKYVETIDLLKDRLVANARIECAAGRSRTVVPSVAYGAIEEAFDSLSEEIKEAAELIE